MPFFIDSLVVNMSTIKIQSSDEVTFEVGLAVASHLGIIKRMLDDMPVTMDGEVFKLPSVKSDTLGKIIIWATHHSKVLIKVISFFL